MRAPASRANIAAFDETAMPIKLAVALFLVIARSRTRALPRREDHRVHEDRRVLLRRARLEGRDRRPGRALARRAGHRSARRRRRSAISACRSAPSGGGNFDVNSEVAHSAKAAIEKRLGADFAYVLDPSATDLPKAGGADYMLLWTSVLEGTDGLGDVDFVYFAGPQDFARYFGFDGNNDLAKLDAFFDRRVASNPGFAKAVDAGLTKAAFRRYYGLRASSTASRGAHDEWNIVRVINERRRADPKAGTAGQVAVLFDGRPVAPGELEATVSQGYAGRCSP